jgi:hypothetical protein
MAPTRLQLATSQRGRQLIRKDGFLFQLEKVGLQKRIWRCNHWNKVQCYARMHTTDSLENPELLSEMGLHNHGPDPIKCDVKQVISELKKKAKTTDKAASVIVKECIDALPGSSQGSLPQLKNMKKNIRRARAAVEGNLVIPHRREDIVLPEKFQLTNDNEQFLFYDSSSGLDRFLIFSTARNLHFLQYCDTWLVDGTFKASPVLFEQLFIIHGQRGKSTFPLVYLLLPRRDTATYRRALTELTQRYPGLAPKTIMSDFELASINAFRETFPQAEQKGCFFHFSQAIFRQIQRDPQLLEQYSQNPEFSLKIRHLKALAFIPPADVMDMFEIIMEDAFFQQNEVLLHDFISYFESTWLGPWNRRKTMRIAPRYEIQQWNCHHSVLEDLPKTNNSAEGFHNGFITLIGACHPTIFKLISGLKSQQTMTDLKINQFEAGNEQPVCSKYAEIARKLKSAVERGVAGYYAPRELISVIANCLAP